MRFMCSVTRSGHRVRREDGEETVGIGVGVWVDFRERLKGVLNLAS